MKAQLHSGPQAYRLTPMQCLLIVSAMLLLGLLIAGCGTTVSPSPTPDSFCERMGELPDEPIGPIQSPAWREKLGNLLGNYDCTCPGGKYYGKHDAMCEPADAQHKA